MTIACTATYVNTSISSASLIAFYSFDSVTTDATGTYPWTSLRSPNYIPGWIGSAISFNAANAERLNASNLPVNGHSFSIDFWFDALNRQCLFLSIYAGSHYFTFFADGTFGTTLLAPNTWCHAAFTVGEAKVGGPVSTDDSYYTGYIDHVSISTRVKSPCEIYLTANLACYFTFDTASLPLDSGASRLTAVITGASLINGSVNQTLLFSSPMTYITVGGISALISAANSAFSISVWVRPTVTIGGATLIHAFTQSNGQGTCLTLWGLTSTGRVSVNVVDASNAVMSAKAISALQMNVWTHFATTSVPMDRPVGPVTIIETSLAGTISWPTGMIAPGQFYGSVDEYRVFRIELTAAEICRLPNPL